MPSEDKLAEYREAVLACHMAARLLAVHDIPKLLEAINHADAVGAILDPTLFRSKAQAMHEERDILRAALALRKFAPEVSP
jgi:hypothetical protein